MNRRRLLALALPLFATLALTAPQAVAQTREVVRVGYQKYGTLIILKAKGGLEQRLAPLGIDVKWTEFPAGPVLLEGLNVGSIDVGTVGEAPPIFAQAAGANLVYFGHEPPAPQGEAIVVPKGSPLKSPKDLKGKKVALNKGSNVHYLLVKVLEANGLQYKDIEPVFLPPADARAAFERGAVDAWVIWDPFLAAAEKQLGARVLADGTGVARNHQFYLASRPYAERRPDVVNIVIEELAKIDAWAKANPRAVAEFLAPVIALDVEIVELAARRFSYGVTPLSDSVVLEQQKIADTFHDLKLIPKKLVVSDVIWKPKSAVASR
ncbi:Putative aliphatic sulfonates-binding protein [Usitatibacter rugosus]|uniref:Putative aliphatic sulfonates-binding protein n=1 Tax=Usitatibacter rugosus TaxID=2732067 RepID=A0A6M4GWK4_9PROT|nr:sulfonate ABC transporter substrate-binding protein [Usitatibacter rugosus]QJR11629.1 Putative aliphatic sulfonates-binding protein [Usitatibacter rugosus]